MTNAMTKVHRLGFWNTVNFVVFFGPYVSQVSVATLGMVECLYILYITLYSKFLAESVSNFKKIG